MIPIVIQSGDPECRLSTALWRALRPFHSTALIARERIAASSSPPDFLIVEGDFFRVELPGNAIAIYTGSMDRPPAIPKHGIAVVATASPQVRKAVAQSGLPAITCGLSAKDTITLSSSTADSLLISLQRGIPASPAPQWSRWKSPSPSPVPAIRSWCCRWPLSCSYWITCPNLPNSPCRTAFPVCSSRRILPKNFTKIDSHNTSGQEDTITANAKRQNFNLKE